MSNSEFKRIEDRLTPPPAPEPPKELLEAIQTEIPEHLSVVPEPDRTKPGYGGFKLIAASVALVVLGGTVAWQVMRMSPSLEEQLVSEEVDAPEAVVETQRRTSRLDRLPEPVVVEGAESTPASEDKAMTPVPERAVPREAQGRDEARELAEGPPPESATTESPALAESLTSAKESPTALRSEAAGQQRGKSGAEELRALGYKSSAQLAEGAAFRVESPMASPSTGGTAEPNDAPYGDMFFRPYGTNPFIDTEDDNLSTFGLDVDTGSFTLARGYLDRGYLPPPESVRVEEFINYFDYEDPAPRRGEFTLVAEGAPSPFAEGPRYQLVRFGIKGREIRAGERQPAVLIFVIDVSGSMQRENRLDLVKRSLEMLLEELRGDDEIGLVVYGSRGEVLLEPTRSKESIRRAIDRLVPGGSTNAEEGLDLAYDLARRHYREGAINRIILCSDGVANVGRTGPESILQRVRGAAEDGIELTTIGFGMGNYNDVLMEQLADQGDGSYAYVDSLRESQRVFVENLTGMLQTIASDAKVQVDFNPETVSRYRLLGYENRDIADDRFRDDTVDAGEIGAGHAVTALYEIKLHEGVGRGERLATLSLRYRSRATDRIVETAIDLDRKHLARSWERSSTAVQLSSLVAELAEILKGSYWAKDASLDDLYERLRPVADELQDDEAVQDLLYLVDRARRLPPEPRPGIED